MTKFRSCTSYDVRDVHNEKSYNLGFFLNNIIYKYLKKSFDIIKF